MNYVEEKDETTNSVRITFLYQPTSGIAPSSFGVNVARIAGIVRFIVLCLKNKQFLFILPIMPTEKRLKPAGKSVFFVFVTTIFSYLQWKRMG